VIVLAFFGGVGALGQSVLFVGAILFRYNFFLFLMGSLLKVAKS
jgi:hypothetical protein